MASLHFPGAVNSKFTTDLEFARPSEKAAMPTYRILDQNGVIVDRSRDPPALPHDGLLKMYNDMLSGLVSLFYWLHCLLTRTSQHNGSHHVREPAPGEDQLLHGQPTRTPSLYALMFDRYLLAKKG